MPIEIHRKDVLRLINEGAQIIDVLSAERYLEGHIPGSINIPLEKINRKTTDYLLQRENPIIVYSSDYTSDQSARAAWRLESLGFVNVFRYTGGRMDWFASNLPMEGTLSRLPSAKSAMRRDIPTCAPDAIIDEVRFRVQTEGWDECVVVNEHRIVLGFLDSDAINEPTQRPVEQLMKSGPNTVRPSLTLEEATWVFEEVKSDHILVTTPDGVLLGVLFKTDVESYLAKSQELSRAGTSGQAKSA